MKCRLCGKETENARKYCSWKCQKKYYEMKEEGLIEEPTEKTCPVCGKIFEGRPNSQYCSKSCRNQADYYRRHPLRRLKCPTCGKEFETTNTTKKYCSYECKVAAFLKRSKEEHQPVEKSCPNCGKKFVPNVGKQECCSGKCSEEYGRLKRFGKRKCEFCGVEFVPHHADGKYCSYKCSAAAKRVNHEKICPICGKTFTPNKRPGQKYCSLRCASKSRRFEKTCAQCGKKYTALTTTQRYCSKECSSAAQGYRPLTKERQCPTCGKKFISTAPAQKYCSTECRPNYNFKPPRVAIRKVCERCGKEYTVTSPNQRYCSAECRQALRECVICGVKFSPKNPTTRYCSDCAKAIHRPTPAKSKSTKPKSTREKTLTEWLREAAECHMDYGLYRALVEKTGRTFEQCKAMNHHESVHQSGGLKSRQLESRG